MKGVASEHFFGYFMASIGAKVLGYEHYIFANSTLVYVLTLGTSVHMRDELLVESYLVHVSKDGGNDGAGSG